MGASATRADSPVISFFQPSANPASVYTTDPVEVGVNSKAVTGMHEVLTDWNHSLLSWWRFEGNASDTQENVSGTWGGTEAYDAGVFGQAASFNGSSVVNLGTHSEFNAHATNAVTVSAWVKSTTDADGAGYTRLVGYSDVDGSYDLDWNHTWGGTTFSILAGDTWYHATYAGLTAGNWYHLVGVYDGSKVRLYVNGMEKAESDPVSGTIKDTVGPLTIGGATNGTSKFSGLVDDVQVYNRGLSADEIGALYDARTDSSLVAYYGFDSNQDTADLSGNDNTFTPNYSPTWNADGKFGGDYQFGGGTNVSANNSSSFQTISSGVTLSAWINASSWRDYAWQGSIISKDGWGHGPIEGFALRSGLGHIGAVFAGTNVNTWYGADSVTTMSAGTWYHVAATYDGIHTKLYINGVDAGETNVAQPNTTDPVSSGSYPIVIGSGTFDTSRYFNGDIDSVKIYNRALSADEIATLYQTNANPYHHAFGPLTVGSYTYDSYAQDTAGTIYQTAAAGAVNVSLLEAPSVQASNLSVTSHSYDSLSASYTRGNGTGALVFVKQGQETPGSFPALESQFYSCDNNFSYGNQVGESGWYCVYNGSGEGTDSFTVNNLVVDTTYSIEVVEYNQHGQNYAYNVTNATGNPIARATDAYATHSIYTCQQLQNINNTEGDGPHDTYKLMADLDCSTVNEGGTFYPIAFGEGDGFYGTFDGQGHSISHLQISGQNSGTGLFRSVVLATIKNLTLVSGSVTGSEDNTGAIVGDVYNGITLINVHSNLSVSSNATTGGLVGYIHFYEDQYQADIENCSVGETTVQSAWGSAGGLIGGVDNDGSYTFTFTMHGSHSLASVTSSGNVGGLIGYFDTYDEDYYNSTVSIQNNYAGGTISATSQSNAGGLIGYMYLEYATGLQLEKNYFNGTVSGTYDVGGLIGFLEAYDDNESSFIIQNNYSKGNLTLLDGGSYAGGIFGYLEMYYGDGQGIVQNLYSTMTIASGPSYGNNAAYLGGLAGTDYGVPIQNSFFAGSLSGIAGTEASYMGSLIGHLGGEMYGPLSHDSYVAGSGPAWCAKDSSNVEDTADCSVAESAATLQGNSTAEPFTVSEESVWNFSVPTAVWYVVTNDFPDLDVGAPVITLTGDPHVIVYAGNTYTDAGAVVADAHDNTIAVSTDNSVNTAAAGTYTVAYDATDAAGNKANQVIRTVDVVPANDAKSTITSAENTHIYIPSSVADASLDVSALVDGLTAVIPNAVQVDATTENGNVHIDIPAGITLTSGGESWDGILNLPQLKDNGSVSINPGSGQTASNSQVLEVGLGDTPLSFDKGVRILFLGKAGKRAGWVRGGTFTEVSNSCNGDTQDIGDALVPNGDCKTNSGDDLVVWTKHFTKYVVYTVSSSGGGGGGGVFYLFYSPPRAEVAGTNLSFIVNDGNPNLTTNPVPFTMNAEASTVRGYSVSLDPKFADASILPYTPHATFTLPDVSGTYTVYLRYYGLSGNSTPTLQATVSYVSKHAVPVMPSLPSVSDLLSILTPPALKTALPGSVSPFARVLRLGDKGEDVRQLQKFLNAHGVPVATKGVGSSGQETTKFGAATKAALIKFQEAHAKDILAPSGLKKGNGLFGPATMKFINNLLSGKTK